MEASPAASVRISSRKSSGKAKESEMATYVQGATQLPNWINYLNSLPWAKGSLDNSSNSAFLRAASLEIEPQTASDEVERRIKDAGGRLRPAKLAHQCQDAYSRAALCASGAVQPSAGIQKWPAVDWSALGWLAMNGPGIYDLWENSPLRWEDSEFHTEEIIDRMFPDSDSLLCVAFDTYNFATRRREEWRGKLARHGLIVPSPMTAVWGRTKSGELSQHSLEAVGPRVYLVIEHDFEPNRPDQPGVDQWLRDGHEIIDVCAAVHNYLPSLLPLACVTSSGGKSLHGFYLVEGRPESDQLTFMREAIRLGACLCHWTNRSQFARIPDGTRGDNGERQTCFYFNPQNCAAKYGITTT
jgi:hypothetical protein